MIPVPSAGTRRTPILTLCSTGYGARLRLLGQGPPLAVSPEHYFSSLFTLRVLLQRDRSGGAPEGVGRASAQIRISRAHVGQVKTRFLLGLLVNPCLRCVCVFALHKSCDLVYVERLRLRKRANYDRLNTVLCRSAFVFLPGCVGRAPTGVRVCLYLSE